MKKILKMLLVAVMCCGMLAGCGNDSGTKLPHNEKISLKDSTEEIIKKGELVELDRNNLSYDYLTQIADGYENAEEELGKQYVKDGESEVIIDGYEFRISYVLNEEENLVSVRYRGSNINKDDQENLLKYLTAMYGEEIKNAEFAFYSEYHQIKVEEGEKTFVVELGIPQLYSDEVWITVKQQRY